MSCISPGWYERSVKQTVVRNSAPACLTSSEPGRTPSEVEDDVAIRLRAADEEVAFGGRVDWVGHVRDRSRDEAALARVTDPGPARPPDGHIARFCQLEQALVGRGVPTRCDAAAGEGDERAPAGLADRGMGWPRQGRDQTGRARFTSGEDLRVDPIRGDAPRAEPRRQLAHEGRGPAKVVVRVPRDAESLEDAHLEMAGAVKVLAEAILGVGPAVQDVAADPRERLEQGSRAEAFATSACNIASTGVAPIPALRSTTGPSPDCKRKLPRGVLTSRRSPVRTRLPR